MGVKRTAFVDNERGGRGEKIQWNHWGGVWKRKVPEYRCVNIPVSLREGRLLKQGCHWGAEEASQPALSSMCLLTSNPMPLSTAWFFKAFLIFSKKGSQPQDLTKGNLKPRSLRSMPLRHRDINFNFNVHYQVTGWLNTTWRASRVLVHVAHSLFECTQLFWEMLSTELGVIFWVV